ncbi:MAG: hypothetical protein HY268_20665 [Deltaproteobacteria bacterium]|nr:hypothetical protein [Deltaproteobacteria bacterium]
MDRAVLEKPQLQQYLVEEISAVLNTSLHMDFYRAVAERLPRDLIFKALAEIKADPPSEIGDPVLYFFNEMHRAARELGVELPP